MLDGFEESPERTFLGVLPSKGTDAEITEREGGVELETVVGGVFLGHRHLATPTVTGSLFLGAEPQDTRMPRSCWCLPMSLRRGTVSWVIS